MTPSKSIPGRQDREWGDTAFASEALCRLGEIVCQTGRQHSHHEAETRGARLKQRHCYCTCTREDRASKPSGKTRARFYTCNRYDVHRHSRTARRPISQVALHNEDGAIVLHTGGAMYSIQQHSSQGFSCSPPQQADLPGVSSQGQPPWRRLR